jgi:type I restriction enzyme S subunit
MPFKYLATQTTLPSMTQSDLENLFLTYPNKTEQQKIADFLDYKTQQIDQLSEKKKALIEKLNEQRIAVITQAVTKGIDKNAKMKLSDVDWLGDVPEHWELPKLIHRTTRIGDGLHSTPQYQSSTGYYFVNGNNLVNGKVVVGSTAKEVSEAEYKKHYIHLDKTTVLLSINGTIGNVALYKNQNIILGKSAAYINCSNYLLPEFLMLYLQSGKTHDFFNLQMTGTTIYNLSLNSIRKMRICLPSIEEQEKIISFLKSENKSIYSMLEKTKQTIVRLEEYRSAIITAAVTGKIDIRNIELPSKDAIK